MLKRLFSLPFGFLLGVAATLWVQQKLRRMRRELPRTLADEISQTLVGLKDAVGGFFAPIDKEDQAPPVDSGP